MIRYTWTRRLYIYMD